MECLAAQIVAIFKGETSGNFYLFPSGSRDLGEEYIYTVYLKKLEDNNKFVLCLKVQAGAMTFFGLPDTKQANMPVLYDGIVSGFDPEQAAKDWSLRTEEPVNDFIDEMILSSSILDDD
ncbi:MAG TPA: hypothetical protein PKC65_16040 [Pyrinomonadaceae bacterium]|nr:hypothetical protein [Pyrinomonadaceae bacterium]